MSVATNIQLSISKSYPFFIPQIMDFTNSQNSMGREKNRPSPRVSYTSVGKGIGSHNVVPIFEHKDEE